MEETNGTNEFGSRLKQILRLKDMTQRRLAKSMYLSEAAICQYVRGNRLPNIPMLVEMAKTLDVSTDQLLGLVPLDSTALLPDADRGGSDEKQRDRKYA